MKQTRRQRWSRLGLLLTALFLAAGLMFAATAVATAQEDLTYTPTARLNLRTGPGLDYAIVDTLDADEELGLTGFVDASGDWVQVQRADGALGWVAVAFLDPTPDADALILWTGDNDDDGDDAVTFSSDVVTATVNYNLNVRSGPGLEYALLETLPAGSVVGFTGFTDITGDWVQVDAADGPLGWVAGEFLSSVPAELEVRPADVVADDPMEDEAEMEMEEETADDFSSAVVTATTTVNLNVRRGPGLEYAILETLPAGSVVGFTGFTDASGDWVQIDAADGPVGWVAAQFLSSLSNDLRVWQGES